MLENADQFPLVFTSTGPEANGLSLVTSAATNPQHLPPTTYYLHNHNVLAKSLAHQKLVGIWKFNKNPSKKSQILAEGKNFLVKKNLPGSTQTCPMGQNKSLTQPAIPETRCKCQSLTRPKVKNPAIQSPSIYTICIVYIEKG